MPGYVPVQLAFDVFEPKFGPNCDLSPVVLHHGFTGSKASWSDIPQNIADGTKRKVYVVDARNHGDSDWTDEFSFELLAEDLEYFLGAHGIKKAIHVGHGMGGITAIRVALKRPELIEKLVVEDMRVSKLQPDSFENILQYLKLIQESLKTIPADADEHLARETIFQFPISESLQLPGLSTYIPLKKGSDNRYILKANLKGLEKSLVEYEAISKELEGTYNGEALFIYGTISNYDVLNDKGIPRHFPNATLYGVRGAKHLVHSEKPEEFTAEVVKFILQ